MTFNKFGFELYVDGQQRHSRRRNLIVNGSGAVTIANANSYNPGGTTLNNGLLNLANASAIGTGPLTINGGTLDNVSGAAMTLTGNNVQGLEQQFHFQRQQSSELGHRGRQPGGPCHRDP